MNADDPRDEELEKEFTCIAVYYPLPVVPSASAAKSKGLQGVEQAVNDSI